MKIEVCIGNNLKYDTRVKRHISALLEAGHNVHVVAMPVPDSELGMEHPNMTYSFVDFKYSEYPVSKKFQQWYGKYNLWDVIKYICPFLKTEEYYNEAKISYYRNQLSRIVAGGRWKSIVGRKAQKMSDDVALSYILTFLDKAMQFAEEALKYNADCILCNDEDTLLCGVLQKKVNKARVVYDFHDLMADISDGVFPLMYSEFLALYEKEFIKYADVVLSVSESELVWSKRHYGYNAPTIAILNCSAVKLDNELNRKEFKQDKLRLYYHGMSEDDRGLWQLIKAVESRTDFVFVIRGLPSDNLDRMKEYVSNNNLEDKIVFLEPVLADEIPSATNKDGDIGYSFFNYKECINWNNALTNKFIEYHKAGLPVLTSAGVEQARIVNKYNSGWVLEDNEISSITEKLDYISEHREELREKSRNAFAVADILFDWNQYKGILVGIMEDDSKIIEENKLNFAQSKLTSLKWDIQDFIHKKGL